MSMGEDERTSPLVQREPGACDKCSDHFHLPVSFDRCRWRFIVCVHRFYSLLYCPFITEASCCAFAAVFTWRPTGPRERLPDWPVVCWLRVCPGRRRRAALPILREQARRRP